MQVMKPKTAKIFHGDDGETITVALLGNPTLGLELTIQDGTDVFCARLGSAETDQLADFLATSYDPLLDHQYVKFTGENDELLRFRHGNMGEPYREVVEINVENNADLGEYFYVRILSHEASDMRKFIDTHPKYQTGS